MIANDKEIPKDCLLEIFEHCKLCDIINIALTNKLTYYNMAYEVGQKFDEFIGKIELLNIHIRKIRPYWNSAIPQEFHHTGKYCTKLLKQKVIQQYVKHGLPIYYNHEQTYFYKKFSFDNHHNYEDSESDSNEGYDTDDYEVVDTYP